MPRRVILPIPGTGPSTEDPERPHEEHPPPQVQKVFLNHKIYIQFLFYMLFYILF